MHLILQLSNILENEIEVVGLTNYFNFKDEDYKLKSFLEHNGIVTFLNLEIRLSNINQRDELFDYHIIFDNTLDNQVVRNLLGELKANVGEGEKAFNMLTPEEIDKKANISFENVQNVLQNNQELNGRYLTGFLSRGHGSATSNSDSRNMAVYENVCKNSDFIIHSSCNDPKSCIDPKCNHNNLSKDREYWLSTSKYKKPLLQSSDAHKFEDIGKKYSWIKSDTTFEGLQQIVYEPEERICLELNKPRLEKDELVIDKINYGDNEIPLSENLNSIIGGRATGKSTLLNSLAKKLGYELPDHYFTFDNLDNFKIIWRDQTENYERKIEYIPQDFMFNLAKDETKLNKLVDKIIKSKQLDEKIDKYKKECRIIHSELQDLLNIYFDIKEKIINLQKPETEKDAAETRLLEYKKSREKILEENNFEDEEKRLFQNQTIEREKALKRKKDINNQKDILNNLSIEKLKIVNKFDELEGIISKELNEFVEEINHEIKDKFDAKISEIINHMELEKARVENEINIIENNFTYKKGLKISSTSSELFKIDTLIKNENSSIEEVLSYEKKKKKLENKHSEIRQIIIDKYSRYKFIRNNLEKEFIITENNLEIKLEFKQIELHEEFSYISGKGSAKSVFIERLISDFDATVEYIFTEDKLTFNNKKSPDDLIQNFFSTHFYEYDFKIVYQEDEFKQMSPGKKAFVILKLILEFSDSEIPVLIDQPEDSLDNRAIYAELTTYIKETKKKRQIIIVTHNPNVVVGSDSENIIIANQHSELTPNKNRTKFAYINGSLESIDSINSEYTLESKSVREHIFEILEGGKEAFQKREQKYNVNGIN